MPRTSSYSQHGEDRIIWELLQEYDLSAGIYVDVGANQPTKISNTYLFYRHGLSGIVIEPNHDLVRLFRKFRPRDVAIPVGCGERCEVKNFRYSNASVFSTFSCSVTEGIQKVEYLPILTLDSILWDFRAQWIFYLSIDAEGLDLSVLRGASQTLRNVLFVSVEYKDDQAGIAQYMKDTGFNLIAETKENWIFRSGRDFAQFKRRR